MSVLAGRRQTSTRTYMAGAYGFDVINQEIVGPGQFSSAQDARLSESAVEEDATGSVCVEEELHDEQQDEVESPVKEAFAGKNVFKVPVMETIDWEFVCTYLSRRERRIVEVIRTERAFRQDVLLDPEDGGSPARRVTRMPKAVSRELIRMGYVKPKGSVVRKKTFMRCKLFAIPRSDGSGLRLIFDGRPMNQVCRAPPTLRLSRIREDVQRGLADRRVSRMVALDFATWFCQLTTSPEVKSFFAVALQGWKGDFVMGGVPMGFSWAPVIAQLAARAILRAVLRHVGGGVRHSVVYIDNLIFFVEDSTVEARVVKALEEVCQRAGATIKPGSLERGTRVEWRGLVLDTSARTVKFCERWVGKVEQVKSFLIGTRQVSVRQWWGALGCMIYAADVRDEPLADYADLMGFSAVKAAQVES